MPFEPTIDCDTAVGVHFIAVTSVPDSDESHYVYAGDSIRLTAEVHRVTQSAEVFDVLGGWGCKTVSSIPVAAALTYSTEDDEIVQVRANGWVRGLTAGFAIVTASSLAPPVSSTLGVIVTFPLAP